MSDPAELRLLSDRPYVTPERRELHTWLGRRSPELADLYSAALQLLFDTEIRQRPRFVAHALREINGQLPDKILGEKAPLKRAASKRLQPTNHLNEIAGVWGSIPERIPLQASAVEADSAPAAKVSIALETFTEMERLIAAWQDSYERFPAKVQRALLELVPENRSVPEVVGPVAKQWTDNSVYFTSVAHAHGREVENAELLQKFELFERTLLNVIGIAKFYPQLDEIDEILGRANS